MGSASGQYGVFRHAGLAVFPYTAANDGIAAARNRDVNAARPNGQWAFHQGKITLLCSLGEFRRGKGILRTQHKAAGVFINAVDRAEYAIPRRGISGGTASRSQGSRWYGLMWGVPQCRQVCSIQPQTHPS